VAPTDADVDEAPAELSARRRRPGGVLLGIVAVAIVVGAGAGWLTTRNDNQAPLVAMDDPGVVHVHGLGVNPGGWHCLRPTHTGLFRLVDAGTDATIRYGRVADDGRLPQDRSTPILLYCKTGRMSQEAATALMDAGFTDVVYLDGGMVAWDAAGRPLE